MSVLNLVLYMEKNMSKMIEVTITNSPFAQSTPCPSGKAEKNLECYNLTNGEDPTAEILHGQPDGSYVQLLRLKIQKNRKTNFHAEIPPRCSKNHNFWVLRSKNGLGT